jgi:hypothetical protein
LLFWKKSSGSALELISENKKGYMFLFQKAKRSFRKYLTQKLKGKRKRNSLFVKATSLMYSLLMLMGNNILLRYQKSLIKANPKKNLK